MANIDVLELMTDFRVWLGEVGRKKVDYEDEGMITMHLNTSESPS